VTGIALKPGDQLASMEVVEPGGDLLLITRQGYGKRCRLEEYPTKGRATGGVLTLNTKALPKTGPIVSARVVQENEEITAITTGGILLRMKVKNVSQQGRSSSGVRLMVVDEGDGVASLARLIEENA